MIRWATALKWLALGFMAASFSASAQQQLTEGKQFLRLKNAQAVESGSKIEVVEFFSYGCIHCYHFEEFIGPWAKKAPADVSFKRVPVVFQPAWVNLGKIMYTLEAMGRDDLSIKVFKSIHDANVRLHEEKVFFEWATSNGLDLAKVKEMWGSFAVNSKMNRAATLAKNYQVESTPMVFVDGKFRPVFGPGSIEFKDAASALDFLVAKARSERSKK
ncbi:MAG: thiol:disulfide interchange protein DsbA/DsbL [Casimicrobium sp.]